MECRDVAVLVDAFLGGRLPARTAGAVLRHLDGCAWCRTEADERRLRASMRSAFDRAAALRVRPEFVSGLNAALHARAASRARLAAARRAVPAAVLAAAVLCIAVIGFTARDLIAARRFEALARAAAGDHRNCALSFRLRERPMPLEEAGRRFGAMYSALSGVTPVTAGQGAGTAGLVERHACVFGGRRFAHFVVRHRGRLASVLVSGEAAGREPASTDLLFDGLSVGSFAASRRLVFVVSPFGRPETQELVRAFQEPVSRALDGL